MARVGREWEFTEGPLWPRKDYSIKSDLKGIWTILLGSTRLVAVMLPIGLALLSLAIRALIMPPIYAVAYLFGGNFFVGVLVNITETIISKFGPGLRPTSNQQPR